MNINDIKAALTAKATSLSAEPNPTIPIIDGSNALKSDTKQNVSNSIVSARDNISEDMPVPVLAKPRKRRVKAVATPEPVTTVPEMVIPDIETIIKEKLIQGRDYDLIAGCKKPSLLKAGAEKLASIFGYYASAEVIHRVELYEKSFVSYEIAVTIKNKTGTVISQGIGSCNSREKRYLKGDFCCQLNTVLKMAKKRAFVDAILTATGASGVFTQDIEDIG